MVTITKAFQLGAHALLDAIGNNVNASNSSP